MHENSSHNGLRNLYLFIFFLCLHFGAIAQSPCTAVITGKITDDHDGSGLGYAIIRVIELEKGVQADSLGNYVIHDICHGTYTLECTHFGCEPVIKKVRVIGDKTIVHFNPEHHAHELEQITVKARVHAQISNPSEKVDKQFLAAQKIANLSKNLTTIPGISSVVTGTNIEKPQIHGLYGNRIGIIQQASRLEDQQWGNEHAPDIDALMADKIEVVKGASSVRFGAKAMGGAIVLEQNNPVLDGNLHGQFFTAIASNALGGGLGVVLEKSLKNSKSYGWKATLSTQKFGDTQTPDFTLSNTGYENHGVSLLFGKFTGKLTHKINVSQRFSTTGLLLASQIGNTNDIDLAIQAGKPLIENPFTFDIQAPKQQVSHTWISYNGNFVMNDQHAIKWHASYQLNNRKEFDARRSGRSNTPAVNMNLHTLQAEITENHHWSDNWRGSIGTHFTYQHNYNIPNTGRRPIIPYYNLLQPAIFVFQQIDGNSVSGEAGIRFEINALQAQFYDISNRYQNPHKTFFNSVASIGGVFRLNKHVDIRSNIGMGFRAPDVQELYADGVHLSAAAYEKGNPDLNSEKSLKIILAAQSVNTEKYAWLLTLHHANIQDYIYQRNDGYVLTVAGAKLKYQYVQSDAQLTGIDASGKVQLSPWITISDQFSYLYAINTATQKGLPLMPPLSNQFEIKIQHNTHTENAHSFWGTVQAQHFAQQKKYDAAELFSPPPPAYGLYNVSLGYTPRSDKWSLELRCDNILNTAFTNYLNRLRYFSHQEVGRNFSLKYRLEF